MADSTHLPPDLASTPHRGRPRQPDTLTPAERAKRYRDRLKAEGLKEVKCYLSPAQLAYLKGVCEIHQVTIADAISLSVTAVLRGEFPAAPAGAHGALAGDQAAEAVQSGIVLLSSG